MAAQRQNKKYNTKQTKQKQHNSNTNEVLGPISPQSVSNK
jgi:hypothetical protein